MKSLSYKNWFRKYGRRGLIIYLAWCLIKGIALWILGVSLIA